MRLGVVLAMAVLAAPTATLAQGRSAGGSTPMGDLMSLNQFATRGFMNQWSATRPAKLSGLSKDAEAWMAAATKRQILSPSEVPAVKAELEAVLAADLRAVAEDQLVAPGDVAGALVLKIMKDARLWIGVDTREDRKAGGVAAEIANARLAQAEANIKAAMKLQNDASLALAMD